MQTLKHSLLARFLSIALAIGIISNMINPMIPQPLEAVFILVVTVLVWFAIKAVLPLIDRLTKHQVKWIIIGALGLMLVGQILVLHYLPVTVYHDPYRVLSQADQISHGNPVWQSTYFWRYPNNVTIAYLLSVWLKFTNLFGLTTNMSLHILSILTLDTFIMLMLKTMYQISHKNRHILFGGLAFMVFTPFAYTYFLQVFYSDLPSLLLLLIIFSIIYFWPEYTGWRQWAAGITLVLAVMLGQLLKPNIIVLIPAILIVCAVLFYKKTLSLVKILIPTVLIVVGFGLSVPAKQAIFSETNYTKDEAFELPTVSWIAMGLNKDSRGTYSGDDIGTEIQIPTKSERATFETKVAKERIQELGPFGLLEQWTIKLGIFLNGANPHTFYNGGLQAAPAWKAKHSEFLNYLVSIIYQVGTILLFANVMVRAWAWRPKLNSQAEMTTLIAIVTTLGYMAFHSLVWETEPRYGQIILPLVMFVLAALPAPQFAEKSFGKRWRYVMPAIAAIALFASAAFLSDYYPKKQIVAAQRSQLSTQYGARAASLPKRSVVTQKVTLNGPAKRVSVQIHEGSTFEGKIINLKTNQRYVLKQTAANYIYEGHLPAGDYQLSFINHQNKDQLADVVSTKNYQLAPYPLVINDKANPHASLVYKIQK
ncbi:hypothetical protein [Weissella viridescens]|uniref:hypothetical protein n=1 Tax=Weissella viridescens TaxID=1629 RepID=UPI003AA86087